MRDTFVYVHLWFAFSQVETICQEKEQMEPHERNTFRERAKRNPCLQVVEQWLATNEFNYSKQLTI